MGKLLKDKVAVVTGAGNGIGRAEAIEMAAQGAKVVVNDIGTSCDGSGTSRLPADVVVKLINDAGGQAVASYASVAAESGAQSIIQTAVDTFGRIDILVNNAGVVKDPVNISDFRTDDWELLIKTHLFGAFFCTRSACSFMKKQGYGRIVNTSSHVGLGWEGFAGYSAAKEGIAGFTRTVARDMAQFGVCCNAIRPIAAWRGTRDTTARVAVNLPEDVAALVVYLASDKAGNINGRIFEVWHGHVGIFEDPPVVKEIIRKDGRWTPDELAERMPWTLSKTLNSQVFPKVLNLD